MQESTMHWGTYGCPEEPGHRRQTPATKGAKCWHQSLSNEQITELFLAWGIVGRRRQINPVLRIMPYFDRGPGILVPERRDQS